MKQYIPGSLCLRIFLFILAGIFFIKPDSKAADSPKILPGNKDQSGWYEKAIANIRKMEYEVSWQKTSKLPHGKAGFHMANRAQNLRVYFFPEGVQMIPRKKSTASWLLGWHISAPADKNTPPTSKPTIGTEKNILKYTRTGFTEKYQNLPTGILCTLLIDQPKASTKAPAITIDFNGNMMPAFEPGDTEIEFSYKNKKQLLFKDINASDAQGVPLSLETTLASNQAQISIDPENASYPICLRFLVSLTPDWTGESDTAGALFGKSAATAGDINGDGYSDIIIGAPDYDNGQFDEGCVYLYYGGANGPSQAPDWVYETNISGAGDGQAVSTAGDVNGDGYSDVLVGMPNIQNGANNFGRVLVYYGSETGLEATPVIIESNAAPCSFGSCVAPAGDVNGDGYADIIVGAKRYKSLQTEEGAVFVYHGSDTGISTTWSWSKTGGQEGAHLGHSAYTAGDINKDGYSDIIIGARYYDVTLTREGRAWVFLGSETGLEATYCWSGDGPGNLAYFGNSVCTAGDVNGDGYSDIVVGAPGYSNDETGEGAAMVYYSTGSGFATTPDFTYEPDAEFSYLGDCVSTAGDVDGDGYADIIVGAYYYSNNEEWEGAAYIFRGSKTGLKTYWDWKRESDQAHAFYGRCVSTAGDVNGDGFSDVIVSAPYYDSGESEEGKCFVYFGKPKTPSGSNNWSKDGTQDEGDFAKRVASAGDVNADGCDDIIIGAPMFDNGQTSEGCVYVFHGRENDVPKTTPDTIIESNVAGAVFGQSMAPAGDTNGDGYDDVIIGAPGYDSYAGWVTVYFGSASGIGASFWSYTHSGDYERCGSSVAGAGDVNGDGYCDIIIGIPVYPYSSPHGRAVAYYGGPSGPSATADWTYDFDTLGASFGECVAGAGDVNADGFSDVIIGAHLFTNGETQEGSVYVFHGSFSGLSKTPNWSCESDQEHSGYGYSAAGAGDVNDDGYADVIVGASGFDIGEQDEGAAFIYAGGPNGITGNAPIWTGQSDQEGAYFGCSVSAAGDVNADGYADVIVGEFSRDNLWFLIVPPYVETREDAGAAHIFLGSPTGPSTTADWSTYSFQSDSYLGRCVAGAGDVNGDGFADVIVGAPGHRVDTKKYGQARLFLGGGGNGRKILLRQFNYNPERRLAHLCKTDANTATVSFTLANPFGPGKIKQEWEYKPCGVPFDGTNTVLSSIWYDHLVISGSIGLHNLSEYALYHWRARLKFHPATTPLQPHSRWYFIPWNGNHEPDFRIGPHETYTVQDIINYIIGRGGYARDPNSDCKTDAADVVHKTKNP